MTWATHFGCRSASTPDRVAAELQLRRQSMTITIVKLVGSILKFIGPVRHAHLPCFRSATPGQTSCSCPQFAASKSGRLTDRTTVA
ncbi:hypothetical protein Ae717Ps2_7228c [Pseudonocardia sp. Ae717_Ps2]|nr:hypothetical protein Ae717Ps2_7228c [Pseudonocardia sp. Ae717_Ps2]